MNRPDPFDVIAAALNCPKESLTKKSAMYRQHRWDIFGHIKIIEAIEAALHIHITSIFELKNMQAICDFFEQHAKNKDVYPDILFG